MIVGKQGVVAGTVFFILVSSSSTGVSTCIFGVVRQNKERAVLLVMAVPPLGNSPVVQHSELLCPIHFSLVMIRGSNGGCINRCVNVGMVKR